MACIFSLLSGTTICCFSGVTWIRLSPPLKAASRSTQQAIAALRESIGELSSDARSLPATLASAERATRSSAAAVRQGREGLREVFAQLEASAITLTEVGGVVASAGKDLRKIANDTGKISVLDQITTARNILYNVAGGCDIIGPRCVETATTVTKITQSLNAPLHASLGDTAATLDSVAMQAATVRTGVIATLPAVLMELANSLDLYVRATRALPLAIDALTVLCLAFGLGFTASGVRQLAALLCEAPGPRTDQRSVV